jgi:hypothetical protein
MRDLSFDPVRSAFAAAGPCATFEAWLWWRETQDSAARLYRR